MENVDNSCKKVKTDLTHNDEEIMVAKTLLNMSLGFANRAVDNNPSNPFSMSSTSVACSPSESLDPSPGPSCSPSSSPSISSVPSARNSFMASDITDIPCINTGTQTLTDYTKDYKMSRTDKEELMQQFSDLLIRFTEYMNIKYPDRIQKNGQMPQNGPIIPSDIPKSTPAHSTSDDGEKKSTGSSKMTILGSHGTLIPTCILQQIAKKRLSYNKATRKILEHFFSKETLATHSLTGKVSPAFRGKPPKKALHQETVEDIVEYVSRQYRETIKQIRLAITTKCADEAKLKRAREIMLEEDDDDDDDDLVE